MMKDTPQGQTNHSKSELKRLCVQNPIGMAERIEELERHNGMLVDALENLRTEADNFCVSGVYFSEFESGKKVIGAAYDAINATSAQSSAWLNKKHVEFMKSLTPEGYKFSIWDGRKRTEVMAIDYSVQYDSVYGWEEIRRKEPLYAIPSEE